MEPPCDRGTTVCSNGRDHMTKMAALPYGKNIKETSSPEPKSQRLANVVYSTECVSTTKFVQMMTLG